MTKQGLKVSGLIAAGKLAQPTAAPAPNAFEAPALKHPAAPAAAPVSETPAPALTLAPPPAADAPAAPAAAEPVAVEEELDVLLLDDSPWQSRKKMNPVRVDEIGQSLESAGQRSPITVRRKPNGRYELLKGHTRKYGAISRGIPKLRALIVERTDREAKLDVWLDNNTDENTDYEFALMFQAALDEKYATTQRGVGELFGYSQAKVSRCLGMMKLPGAVLAVLEREPALFGSDLAADIVELCNQHPDKIDVILEGLARLSAGGPQLGFKAWVLNKIKGTTRHVGKGARHFSHASGDAAFMTSSKGREITFRISDEALDVAQVRRIIEEAAATLLKK